MTSRLNPYLSFDGNARGEYGASDAPGADNVMHSVLESESGFTLMAADMPPGMTRNVGDHITISVSGEDGGELRAYWDKLADGGNVNMPLEKQMWGDEFGMCTDKFGTAWMVNITQAQG
jgi:PhnB protein